MSTMGEDGTTVIPIRVTEPENFLETAKRMYEEFGDRITGSFLMLRLDGEDNTNKVTIYAHRSWPSTAELIGRLAIQAHRITATHFFDDAD